MRVPRFLGSLLTVKEAQVVAQFSSDYPLLHERLHAVWKPPRGFHSHDRGLCAHLPHVEVRRHVRAHVLVGVVGKVREAFQPAVDEGLEVVTRRLRSRNEPGDLCRRRDQKTVFVRVRHCMRHSSTPGHSAGSLTEWKKRLTDNSSPSHPMDFLCSGTQAA